MHIPTGRSFATGRYGASQAIGTAALALALLGVAPDAGAVGAPAEFYSGKIVTIVVGFSPGGGFDAYARLLAHHLGRHIPGEPSVIVENMPGAGSLTAVRYLDATAPADGTVMVTFNQGLLIEALTDPAKVKAKMAEFAWVGSISQDYRVCYAWGATGVKTWADVMKRKEFVLGSTSKTSSNYVNGATLHKVLGAPIKQIMGFPGSAEQRLAIERGELDGDCGSWPSIPDDWLRDKKINAFVRFTKGKTPDMPDVPYASELTKDPDKKALIDFLGAPNAVSKPYIMSKRVPPERLAVLRRAFDDTMKDKDLLAEAAKQTLPITPVGGAAAAQITAGIAAAKPALIKQAAEVLK